MCLDVSYFKDHILDHVLFINAQFQPALHIIKLHESNASILIKFHVTKLTPLLILKKKTQTSKI